MKVRRSSLGGYWVDGKRWASVTEVLTEVDSGIQYASQQIVLRRIREFFADVENGLIPASCLATMQVWGDSSLKAAGLWLGTDEGQRWLAAGWTKETNGYMDRGTILHLFKDELSQNAVWTEREIEDWLEERLTAERELSKATRDEYEEFTKEDAERLKFPEWHDRYAHGKPQRPFDCEHSDVLPYLLSLSRWWQDEAPEFVWVERVLLLRSQEIAGTADGLCAWRGKVCLADFKTSKTSGTRPTHALQIGGYSLATHYYDKETDKVEPLAWENDHCVVFTVTPEKVYPYVLKDLKEAQKLFKYELAKQRAPGLFHSYNQSNAMTKNMEKAS